MKNSPLVSIIVPVYNIENYVRRCLDSLLRQKYKNIEIVVVDDGSTDASGEICDNYAKDDARIKVWHKKNGGLSSARNYGIRKARGDYVCLVDGDDYVKEDFVWLMAERMKEKNADIVVCGYNKNVPMVKMISGREATVKLLIEQENMEVIAWNKMYRRYLFDKIEYPEGENYEDSLTTYKLLAEARGVVYVPESLYVYVERGGSITNTDQKEARLVAREKAAREAIKYFAGDEEFVAAAEIALLTAKLAFVDFAISGKSDEKSGEAAIRWIKKNAQKYGENKYMTVKLKIYIKMVSAFGGVGYKLFRKIRHE